MNAGMESLVGPDLPWWRVPMVWLVISGPAAVVLAGITTLVIAARGADPVVSAGPARYAEQPAVAARNHAATAASPR
jgi:uncharacterized protein